MTKYGLHINIDNPTMPRAVSHDSCRHKIQSHEPRAESHDNIGIDTHKHKYKLLNYHGQNPRIVQRVSYLTNMTHEKLTGFNVLIFCGQYSESDRESRPNIL